MLTQSLFDPCLWIYPYPMWEQLLSALNAQTQLSSPAMQSLQRLLLSSASAVKLDAQGRFAVSAALFVIITLTGISWVGFNSHDYVRDTTTEIVTNAHEKFGV